MEKGKVVIDNPVTSAGLTLIPIVKVSSNYWHSKAGDSFWGIKQPVSVVVVSSSAKKAFRVTGEEIPLEQLIQEVAGIKEILERI